jgi:hypothetical protein
MHGKLWLISGRSLQIKKTLEVYVLLDERWLLLGDYKDDEQVPLPPFEALELEFSALWPCTGIRSIEKI